MIYLLQQMQVSAIPSDQTYDQARGTIIVHSTDVYNSICKLADLCELGLRSVAPQKLLVAR
jgi:hypothetical protein